MKVYLAGPDVFLPDPITMAERKRSLCAAHGLTGIFPVDAHPQHPEEAEVPRWLWIYRRNEAHMRDADAVIANLTPFRGPSADAGTVYELGFMRALGKLVLGYSNVAADFVPRNLGFLGRSARRDAEGRWRDGMDMAVEDFGLADNLMIDGGIKEAGGIFVRRDVPESARWTDLAAFETCVRTLAALSR
ncbi:nucleoside 2-deoxyribosyltransferase [Roseomonas sp. AR75]|uniref:nucleoside 2-deoxyribosyltransferase n=1 Tax=Roseomonas sp. AR75 TaxID=2562311 RepID=UPI0010C12300|nr:nucleoside 2-deoxyribosyltransferase [Roseomonas sp. AR75]